MRVIKTKYLKNSDFEVTTKKKIKDCFEVDYKK